MQGELETLRANSVDAESAAAAVAQRESRIAELQEQVGVAMGDAEEAQQVVAVKEAQMEALREEAAMAKAELQRVMEVGVAQEEVAEGLRSELAAAKQQLHDAAVEAAEKLARAVEEGQQGSAEVAALVAKATETEGVIAGLQEDLQGRLEEVARLRQAAEASAAAETREPAVGGVGAAVGAAAAGAAGASSAAASAAAAAVTPVKAAQASGDTVEASPSPARSTVSTGGAGEDVAVVRKKLHQAIRKGKTIQAERDELKTRVEVMAGEAAELREQVCVRMLTSDAAARRRPSLTRCASLFLLEVAGAVAELHPRRSLYPTGAGTARVPVVCRHRCEDGTVVVTAWSPGLYRRLLFRSGGR